MKRNCEKKKGAGGEKTGNRNIQVRWNLKRSELRPGGVILNVCFGRWQISRCNLYSS